MGQFCVDINSVFSGRVESGGALPRMMTGENADEYIVYWGEDALEKWNEN
jgi:hypothetical protein